MFGGINGAFFKVLDKLIELQSFFLSVAWGIASTTFLIALLSAAINYAMTGEGLKANLVKIGKATAFCGVILGAYPWIIGKITIWTFEQAEASTFNSVKTYITKELGTIATKMENDAADATAAADAASANRGGSNWRTQSSRSLTARRLASEAAEKSEEIRNVQQKFYSINARLLEKRSKKMGNTVLNYTTVAPGTVLELVWFIAGECMDYVENGGKGFESIPAAFGRVLTGLIRTFCIILTGIFAIIEYILAYMEFILVSSVGIFLFPLQIWEGSKFLSEKFVGAIVGFFIKLLFCTICIFFMLYGFFSIAKGFTTEPFTGAISDIIGILFSCLLFFYLCKSAPGLAQSLLTGTPSLSAAGAVGAVAGAAGAVAGTAQLAQKAGGALASAGAKGGFGLLGMGAQAFGAMNAVKQLGGGIGDMAKAGLGSVASSAGSSIKAGAGDLARSLLGGGGKGGGGGAGGINRNNQLQKHLGAKGADGSNQTLGEYAKGRKEAGTNRGLDYMAKKEARQNGGK